MLTRIGSMRAGQSGPANPEERLWWTALLSVGAGEVACAFARVVLGLREGLSLSLWRSTVTAIQAPNEEDVETLNKMSRQWGDPHFVIFCNPCVIVALTLIFLLGSYHENKHSCCITICSMSGVLLAGYVKGLGITLKNFLLESLSWDTLWLGCCC